MSPRCPEPGARPPDACWLVPEWHAPARVRACTTTRLSGWRLGWATSAVADPAQPDAAVATDDRHLLQRELGLAEPPYWLRQVHGIGVADADLHAWSPDIVADAAVSRTPGRMLAILTADCLPVLFASDDGSEVAACHAGWRGLAAGMIEATLAAMRTPAGRVHAWIGPCICQAHFEVGEDVLATYAERNLCDAVAFVPTRPGHALCDLPGLARRVLERAGVHEVSGGSRCTYGAASLFHSYRREGAHAGRIATLVGIRST